MDREESSVMEMDEMHSRLAGGQSQIDLKELGEKLRSKSGKEVSNFIRKYIKFLEKTGCFFVRKNSAVIWIFCLSPHKSQIFLFVNTDEAEFLILQLTSALSFLWSK